MNERRQRLTILIATLACAAGGATPALGYDVWYVNGSLTTGQDDGSSWDNAFRSTVLGVTPLRRAINAAQENDEVWVAQGTYKPAECVGSCTSAEQDMYFELKNKVKLLGGFAGCETCSEQRNWRRYETILSGDLLGDDDPAWPPPTGIDPTRAYDNSYNVVRGAMDLEDILHTIVDGFTITGGYDQTGGLYPEAGGGGIRFTNDGNATVRHCKIVRNWAANGGGGIYSFGTLHAYIVECIIAENVAWHGGGLAAKVVASPLITNCLVTGNLAYDSGAGLHFEGFNDVPASSPRVVNTLVARNVLNATEPSSGGAGIYAIGNQTRLSLRNSTVAYNVVNHVNPAPGGGLSLRSAADADIYNTTFWANSAGDGHQIHAYNIDNVVTSRFSNIQRLQSGDVSALAITYEHCIGTLQGDDPQFRDADGADNVAATWQDNDYTMLATSKSMDSASNVLVAPDDADLDEDGDRIEPTPYDQRASFRFVDNPTAPNCQIFPQDPQCTNPPPPVVDVGALEDLDCGSLSGPAHIKLLAP